jgi:hypothetical protein
MTTQYTPTLKLALPVTGELSGTWGDIVNDNITSMIEQAITGLATINTWTANAHTLTTANGTTSESRCAVLVAATGSGGSAITGAGEIICPAAAKLYVVQNTTSFAVTLKTSAGTGVAVAAGNTAFLFCDGTNVNACVTTIIDGRVTGNLTVDGNATINGNTTLGNATSDTVTVTARVASNVLPSADNTYDLGSAANAWKDLYIDGTATIATLNVTTIDTTNLEVTNIKAKDGTASITIADSTGAVSFANNVTLGDATTDTVTVNGYMGVGGGGNSGRGIQVVSTALTGGDQFGVYSNVTASSSATTALRLFQSLPKTAVAAFTCSNIYGFSAEDASLGAGSSVTNLVGVQIADQTQGTNNYGIRSLVSSGTNKWNIYASGTAANYFAGNVGIATTDPATYGVDGSENLVIGQAAGNAGLTISSFNTSTGTVAFSDVINATVGRGYVTYNHSGDSMAFGTLGAERMRIDSSGNLLLGTSTSYTSTTTAGGMALVGYGVYPYTTQTGAANSTALSSLTAVPTIAATGSTSITLSAGQFSPALSNDGTGGSNTVSLLGISSNPVITSSGSTARVSLTGVQGIANRGNAADTSTNASNALTGGTFGVTHGTSLPTTAVSGTAVALTGAVTNAAGTMTAATAVRAAFSLGSLSTFNTNSTPTAIGFELSSFTVGAPTAVGNATVTNGYGIKLAGPVVGVTGTMTNYYAFRADAPTVSGTLTNRYGIWMDDSQSTNYFAGNVGIGTTTPAAKLDVTDNAVVLGYFRGSGGSANDKRLTFTTGGDRVILDAATNSTGAATALAFTTGGTERMRLSAAGGLSIGTTTDPGAGGLITTGNVTLGDATTDTVTVNGYMGVGGAGSTNIALKITNSALTSTSQYGVASQLTGSTAGTSDLIAFLSLPATAASAYTVTNLVGFQALNPTLGAGSAITNQYGVFIADQTRATNNYGITSAVSSGTNKWNIYASGTAQNYFAGNVGIGTTTPANQLTVSSAASVIIQALGTNAANPSLFRAQNSDGVTFDFRMNGSSAATNPSTAQITTSGTQSIAFIQSGVESMRIIGSSNNVGIGTATPSSRLDVADATSAILTLTRTDSTAGNGVIRSIGNTGVTNASINLGGGVNNNMVFNTNGSERMRILSTGEIIRGGSAGVTSTGGSVLGIETLGGTTAASSIGQYAFATTNAAPFLEMGFSRNATVGSQTVVNSGDVVGAIRFSGSDGTNFVRAAQIAGVVDGTPGTNDMPGRLVFSTSADGSASPAERMRIDSAGNIQTTTGSQVVWAPAPASISTAATLTNANIQGQIINTTGTSYTVTMPLGSTLETLVSWATTDIGYNFTVINTASGTITMAVNTGVTSLGALTIATGTSANFRIRRTAANTFILYRMS